MADDKQGRDKQARDGERRRRERDIVEELERWDETEPPVDVSELGGFETELETLEFPATGREVVAVVGDREIESAAGTYTVEELVPDADQETFQTPSPVRVRVQRPTVAAAMKRIVEAAESHQSTDLSRSQREAYEKTLRELKAIDAADDDEGVRVVSDWIVERIHGKGTLPGSRDVRREAGKFCRANGYEVRNDDWLGV